LRYDSEHVALKTTLVRTRDGGAGWYVSRLWASGFTYQLGECEVVLMVLLKTLLPPGEGARRADEGTPVAPVKYFLAFKNYQQEVVGKP
jgi:hypothetical protein